MPSDLSTHISHTTPRVNFNTVPAPNPLDLNSLNQLGGDVYLTSNDDITTNPEWLKGVRPDGNGKTAGTTAAVIVNDKGNGDVDAFYMFFYTYNWGGEVLGLSSLNFGNHVGDWEHIMIRFKDGQPQAVWYSQHANGQAFKYSVRKIPTIPAVRRQKFEYNRPVHCLPLGNTLSSDFWPGAMFMVVFFSLTSTHCRLQRSTLITCAQSLTLRMARTPITP